MMESHTRKVKFAAIQMSMKIEDKEANISKAESMIDEAVEKYNPDIIGLPELFNTEYFPAWLDRKYFSYAEPIPGPTINRIAKIAKKYKIYVIAPIFEEAKAGVYYDSSPVISPDGNVIGVYRKVHIPIMYFPEGGDVCYEPFYFRSGTSFPVFKTKFGHIGQVICYDRHFPESWRLLQLNGAEIICVPLSSVWGFMVESEQNRFVAETSTIAFTTQCFTVVINRVGSEDKNIFFGSSHILNPNGELLAGPASTKEDEILCATLDLNEISDVRQKMPFLRERHPEFYKPITTL